MGRGTSTLVIKWINLLTMLLAIALIFIALWMGTRPDACKKSLTLPLLCVAISILVISVVGFLGAWRNVQTLLWIYLGILCLILVAILAFTVMAFILTNSGSGRGVSGLKFKEYHLQDFHPWFIHHLNRTRNWGCLKTCLVKSNDCSNLGRRYRTLREYQLAELTPIEAGCCRPPSACGYPPRNASYFDLSFRPLSSSHDCKLYGNSHDVKCYSCDSCKAGVAQYIKIEWRVVAIFNLALFAVLFVVYFVACCARRNAGHASSFKL